MAHSQLLVAVELELTISTIESRLCTLKPVVLDVADILVAHALGASLAAVTAIFAAVAGAC